MSADPLLAAFRPMIEEVAEAVARKIVEELQAAAAVPAPPPRKVWYTAQEAAEFLGVGVGSLEDWRRDSTHPLRWHKPSGERGKRGGRVRYHHDDLIAFQEYSRV